VERANHLEEVGRLTLAYNKSIEALQGRVERTAGTQAVTADKLKDAAAAVVEVVDKVDAAAVKADKAASTAAQQAAKVAKVLPATPPATTVQPEVVNREIRRANERLPSR
jgi:methyl-accepting chemotaxis protein